MQRLLNRFVLLLTLFMLVSSVLAQEVETNTSTIGPLTLTHPDSWFMLQGPSGSIVLAEFDPHAVTEENPMPDDAVIVQIQLLGLQRVAGLLDGDEDKEVNILGGLLFNSIGSIDQLPDITQVETEVRTFARADISNDALVSIIYTGILSEETFGVITISTDGANTLAEEDENAVLAILDTAELEFESPVPEDAFSRYEALTIGTSEDGLPALGDPDAPVTITEISSFDCPHCRTFHDLFLPELLPRIEAGEIRFIYVPVYGTGSIPNGDSAARAAMCVGDENFWAFHDTLFSWQDFEGYAYAYERLQNGAEAIGIDPDDFDECYISDKTNFTLTVARQFTFDALGERWSTPTVLVNGEKLEALDLDLLNEQIDAALNE